MLHADVRAGLAAYRTKHLRDAVHERVSEHPLMNRWVERVSAGRTLPGWARSRH
jgi:hypothetical protein